MLRDTMIFDEQLTPQKREGQSDVRRRRRLCARGDNVIVEKSIKKSGTYWRRLLP